MAIVIVGAFAIIYYGATLRSSSPVTPFSTSAARPTRSLVLLNSDETLIEPSQYRYWTFKVLPEMKGARIVGKFEASGGAGNDIRLLLLTPPQFVQWQNHTPNFAAVYDSGQAHTSILDVALIAAGTYHLVLDNTFSIMASKNVAGDIRLMYGE